MERKQLCLFLLLIGLFSGLQQVQAGRMYDPEVSRFLSIDPALHEQMPQQLLANHPRLLSDSPYSYGYNNPLRFTDPDGKTPWDLIDIAFAVMSVKDAIHDPSASNIFWAGVDVLAAAAPIIPSSRGARMALNALDAVDDVVDAAKAVDKAEDVASGVRKTSGKRTPDLNAEGDHSVFNERGNTTYVKNEKNPSGFDETKRVDTQGKGHRNRDGTIVETPHVHEKGKKDVRKAEKGKDY